MRRSFARPSPAFKAALLAGVVALFAVSGGMLWFVGYNYDGLQGTPLTKIHPFTYWLFALALWRLLQSGAPIAFLSMRLAQRPAATWLLAVSALLIVVSILRGAPGLAGFVDTFAGPALLALLIDDFDQTDLAPLVASVHVLLTINAVVGLAEFATHTLFFPYRLDGVAHLEDTRSTALQGHPLLNASLTGVYVISLLGGAKAMPAALRAGQFLLQMAALVVFGGRTAIIVVLALLPFFAIHSVFATLRRGRVSLPAAAFACAALPMLALAMIAALSTGIADLLLYRFQDDNGSAATRIVMFEMLRPFSIPQLLVGPDIEQVESLRRHFGLELGIENPFIRMTLYQGGLVMAAVSACLTLFFRELLRGRGLGVIGPVIAMAVLLNSSESIASKTNILDKFVLIFVCLFPLLPRAVRRAPLRDRALPARFSRPLGPLMSRPLSPPLRR